MANKQLLINCLNNILEYSEDEEIIDTEIVPTQILTDYSKKRHSILDVFCILKCGKQFCHSDAPGENAKTLKTSRILCIWSATES